MSNIKKLHYPQCQTNGHGSEPLSRICIDEKCRRKTIICCICEYEDHQAHKTIPIKSFLQKIDQSAFKDKEESINPLYFASIVDQAKETYFSMLGRYKKQILEELSDLEVKGRLYFSSLEELMLSLIQMKSPLDFFSRDSCNTRNIKDYFASFLQMVNLEDKEGFNVQKKLEGIVEFSKEKQKKINQNYDNMMKEFTKMVKKSCQLLEEKVDTSSKMVSFRWSQTLKGHKIKINGMIAQQTGMQSSGQRFGLMDEPLASSGKMRWGVRVKKFVGWVGVGICLRNIIKNANYFFNYTNIGHGSYLISSNGYSWSHSVKQFNSAYKTFQFTTNDTVYIEYDPQAGKMRFKKNLNGQKFQLTVVPPPAGDAYHPCVNLCSTGDNVELVVPGIPLS